MNIPRATISLNSFCRFIRYLLSVFVFLGVYSGASATLPSISTQVEVFTATADEIVNQRVIWSNEHRIENIDLQVYKLNGIQLVEEELSNGLTADPEWSKRKILQHIQILDGHSRMRMQHSAIGLSKAIQYGVDRVPAIVFDGQAVVYGVTDMRAAFARYEAWRKEAKP